MKLLEEPDEWPETPVASVSVGDTLGILIKRADKIAAHLFVHIEDPDGWVSCGWSDGIGAEIGLYVVSTREANADSIYEAARAWAAQVVLVTPEYWYEKEDSRDV